MSISKQVKILQLIIFSSALLAFSNAMAHHTESCIHSFQHKEFQSALQQCTWESEQTPTANFILGQIYEKGLGVEKNINKAMSYYRVAVLSNNVDAQMALGKLQADNGKYLQSHTYFSLAVDNGSLNALHLKNSIEKNLSNQDLLLSRYFLEIVKDAIISERKAIAMN